MTERHLRKRSFSLAGHRTSVALEPAFWAALEASAQARALSLAALVAQVDAARVDAAAPLASALRVFALADARGLAFPPPPDAGEGRDRSDARTLPSGPVAFSLNPPRRLP